jgi:hypothetical protein
MLMEVDEGMKPDAMAMEKLRTAQNSLRAVGKVGESSSSKYGDRRRKRGRDTVARVLRANAAKAVWNGLLRQFTTDVYVRQKRFETVFALQGREGYLKFVQKIEELVLSSLESDAACSAEEKEKVKVDWTKPQGWLQNIPANLSTLWDSLVENIGEEKYLGEAETFDSKKSLLATWSRALHMAKNDSNVMYKSKIKTIGPYNVEDSPSRERPSRCIPDVRSIHFLRKDQVLKLDRVGKGVQGGSSSLSHQRLSTNSIERGTCREELSQRKH